MNGHELRNQDQSEVFVKKMTHNKHAQAYSQPSTLPKDVPAKFHLSTTFGLSFVISSVAPPRSSTFTHI